MNDFNQVTLLGRLCADPELRHLPNGTPKTEIRLATSREWKSQNGEKQKETCYVTVVSWARQAEIVKEFLARGRQVLISGRLGFDEWEDQDGKKRSKHYVTANSVVFIGGPDDNQQGGGQQQSQGGNRQQDRGGYGGGGGQSYGGNQGGGRGQSYGGSQGGGGQSYSGGGQSYGGPPNQQQSSGMAEGMGVPESDLPF